MANICTEHVEDVRRIGEYLTLFIVVFVSDFIVLKLHVIVFVKCFLVDIYSVKHSPPECSQDQCVSQLERNGLVTCLVSSPLASLQNRLELVVLSRPDRLIVQRVCLDTPPLQLDGQLVRLQMSRVVHLLSFLEVYYECGQCLGVLRDAHLWALFWHRQLLIRFLFALIQATWSEALSQEWPVKTGYVLYFLLFSLRTLCQSTIYLEM